MNYEKLLNSYIAERYKEISQERIQRVMSWINDGISYFAERGITSPNDNDFETMSEYLKNIPNERGVTRSEKTVKEYVSNTQKFFKWLYGGQQMAINDFEQEKIDDMRKENIEKPEKKRGRKPKDEQEQRSEKISLYLTKQLANDLNDLAHSQRMSITELFFRLANEYVEQNQKRLNSFRDFLNDNEK